MRKTRAGLIEESTELGARFSASAWTPSKPNYTYDDVKRLIELYCDVIWLDERTDSYWSRSFSRGEE